MNETTREVESARSYTSELVGALLVYAAVLVPVIWWINLNPDWAGRWILALLPMVPVILVARSILRFFRRMDELARRQVTETLAFAFAASALFVLTLGFLQVAGIPHFSVWWIWFGMGALWIISSGVTAARYR